MRLLWLALVICCSISGCSALKAKPAQDSGFLSTPARLKPNEQFPFHAWWVKPGAAKSQGGSVYIAPVNTDFLGKVGDWSHVQTLDREQIIQKAEQLGIHFRERIREKINNNKEGRFTLVDKLAASDGVLELAIVELVPTDVVRNAAGTTLGFFVPGGGLVSTGASGSIAIEGRFRETATGEVVAEFKDRETGRIAPVDLAGLTAFRHAERAVEDWADQIVEILESPKGAVVADTSPFSLLPW